MAINSDSTIDRIQVEMQTYVQQQASSVIAYNGSQRIGKLTGGDFDATPSDEFIELDRRVEAGTAAVEYITPMGRFTTGSVPAWARNYIDLRDPFARRQTTLTAEQAVDVTNTIWYKRASAAPTLPSFDNLDGITVTADSIMAGAGWTKRPPTGTDTLYYTLITYSVADDLPAAEGTAPETDDIQYSTDHGETWLDAAPDDYDTVTDIRYYVPGNPGLWATENLKPEVIDPLIHFGGTVWQNGGNGNDDYDQYIDVAANTNLLDDNYLVGCTIREVISWSDHRPNFEGSWEMPVDAIVLTTPQQYEGVDSEGRVPHYTYLVIQSKENGACRIGLSAPGERLSDYSTSYYGAYFMNFISYPKTALTEAVTASATSLYLESVAGLTSGNTLYIGNERMRVVSIGDEDSAHGGGHLVVVDRAHSGTTAAAHADNAEVRGIVNKDAVRYILIGKRRGVADRTQKKFWRVRKRGAE